MSRVVTFHYTLRDPAGRVLDTSTGGEPISFLEGAEQIIEGLDAAIQEMAAGTQAEVKVPAARAYGERDEQQIQRVLKSLLPIEGELHAGDRFQAGEDPAAPVVTVVAVEGDEVLLDGNHPLAGVDLVFDVQIISARPASAEEQAHRHVHGEGGQCS